MSTAVFFSRFDTSLGRIWCASYGEKLVRIALPAEQDESFFDWLKARFPESTVVEQRTGVAEQLFVQLSSYLQRKRKRFELWFDLRGTPFQKEVWTELVNIPYGEVISYGELAHRLGRSGSFRAVGAANGANPLPIVVPCHRVIGSDRKLVGYGGGLEMKAFLLGLETGQDCLPLKSAAEPASSFTS